MIFFIWPAGQALLYSLQRIDPFGLSSEFVGLENFRHLLDDPYYLDAFSTTLVFSHLMLIVGVLLPLCGAGGRHTG